MDDERTRLQRWENRVEWPLAACALAFLVVYSVEVLAEPQGGNARLVSLMLDALYVPFLIDYLVRLSLARQRLKWFFTHPLDLAVVTLPFLQPLRFLRLVALIKVLQKAFGDAVRGRVIAFTAFGAILIIYSSALAELKAERYAPDSRITSFPDAVWWAISTITTVGYGDYVPTTKSGRVIAVLLMIGGISLIGVVTATVAHWIVSQVAEEDVDHEAATVAHIQQLRDEIAELRGLLSTRDADGAGPPQSG